MDKLPADPIFGHPIEYYPAAEAHQEYVVLHFRHMGKDYQLKLTRTDYEALEPYKGAHLIGVRENPNAAFRIVIQCENSRIGLFRTIYGIRQYNDSRYRNGDVTDLRRENVTIPLMKNKPPPHYEISHKENHMELNQATMIFLSLCIKDDKKQSFSHLVKYVAELKHVPIKEVRSQLQKLRKAGLLGYYDPYPRFVRWEGGKK